MFLLLLVISSLGILPMRVWMLKTAENNSCLFKRVEALALLSYKHYLSKVFSEGNDKLETVRTCADTLPHYVVGIDLSILCKPMPESSYHLKFLPSVGLGGGISHLFRQKNSDQKIDNKKDFPVWDALFVDKSFSLEGIVCFHMTNIWTWCSKQVFGSELKTDL